MLYIGTFIKVIDNSGARFVKCLKILGKSFKGRGKVGDILIVTIDRIRPRKRVKKGEIYKAVVIRTKFRIYRYGGFFISLSTSGVVLFNLKLVFFATRILGPICREMRQKSFSKVVSLSPIIV